jgi:excisionase family DNA binding protein
MVFLCLLFAALVPDFYSVQSAARDFFCGQVSPWTIRSWLRTGKLRAYKAGSRVIVKRSDLEALMRPRPVSSNGDTQRVK